jgi:hypothetical protein
LPHTSVFSEHKLATTASGTAIEIRSSSDRETPVIFVGLPGALIVKAFAEHNEYSKSRVYLGDLSDFIAKKVEEEPKKDGEPKKEEEPKQEEATEDKKDDAPEDKKEEAPTDQ